MLITRKLEKSIARHHGPLSYPLLLPWETQELAVSGFWPHEGMPPRQSANGDPELFVASLGHG